MTTRCLRKFSTHLPKKTSYFTLFILASLCQPLAAQEEDAAKVTIDSSLPREALNSKRSLTNSSTLSIKKNSVNSAQENSITRTVNTTAQYHNETDNSATTASRSITLNGDNTVSTTRSIQYEANVQDKNVRAFENKHPRSKVSKRIQRQNSLKRSMTDIGGTISLAAYRRNPRHTLHQNVKAFINEEAGSLGLGDSSHWRLESLRTEWGNYTTLKFGYFIDGFKRPDTHITVRTDHFGDIRSFKSNFIEPMRASRSNDTNNGLNQAKSASVVNLDKPEAIDAAKSAAQHLMLDHQYPFDENDWHFWAKRIELVNTSQKVWRVKSSFTDASRPNIHCTLFFDLSISSGELVNTEVLSSGHPRNKPNFCQVHEAHH